METSSNSGAGGPRSPEIKNGLKLKLKIGEKTREVEMVREGEIARWRLDGRAVEVNAIEIAAGTYSILLEGQAFEVHLAQEAGGLRAEVSAGEGVQTVRVKLVDPRAWQGRHGHTVEVEGRLQILAPMPGKIVRVLVKQGDAVSAGQGIAVIEAMKMQNEVRSRKTGIVERVMVAEGKTVNAGEVVAVVV